MRKIWLCLLAILMLGGCTYHDHRGDQAQSRVVLKIDIDYHFGALSHSRSYRDNEKMREVLNYLRTIKPYGPPEEDPATAFGSLFIITLIYSDGSHKTYLQKSNRYLLEEGGSWQKINPQKAALLGDILAQTPSDP